MASLKRFGSAGSQHVHVQGFRTPIPGPRPQRPLELGSIARERSHTLRRTAQESLDW